jgi:hypothetical protein
MSDEPTVIELIDDSWAVMCCDGYIMSSDDADAYAAQIIAAAAHARRLNAPGVEALREAQRVADNTIHPRNSP